MPAIPASRKFEIVTAALALAEERNGISIPEAAALVGVSDVQLRELLAPVLYLEYRDAEGSLVSRASEFFLDEETDVLEVDEGGSHWLRDLAGNAPSSPTLLRLYVAATVYQATTTEPSPVLDRALSKLRQAVATEMVVPIQRPPAVGVADEARRSRRTLWFRYVKWKDDRPTDREVLPLDVYCDWGKWYVVGPEVGDDVVKHWVIGRMQDVVLGESRFEPMEAPERRAWFDLGDRTRTVTVRVPAHRLAALPKPHTVLSRVDDGGDWVVVEIEVNGDRQLDHLLVSLGPGGDVLEPAEYRDRRAAEARRLLAHVDDTKAQRPES